jgi:aspartate/tyrosine/aromatic aminotransferase
MPRVLYISAPTWPNHITMAEKLGLKIKEYPYWNAKTRGFDCEGMLKTL